MVNTLTLSTRLRRASLVGVVALAATFGMSGTATAFVPPGDGAAENFGCGPAGHPGHEGQFMAMNASGGQAAWNAHANSEKIVDC